MVDSPIEVPPPSEMPTMPTSRPSGPSEPPPVPRPRTDTGTIEGLLRAACGECHGDAADGDCAGGLCEIYEIDTMIIGGFIVPGDPNASPLYRLMATGQMPPPGASSQLNDDQILDIRDYILGLPPIANQLCGSFELSWDDVYQAIESDILSAPAEARPFTRYLSISNSSNAGECAQQLEFSQWAMKKFINSISRGAEIHQPTLVNDAFYSNAIYKIDLRDYRLEQTSGPFVVGGTSYSDGWEAMVGNNEYAVEFQGVNADNVALQTGTTVPVMFVDSLIARATVGDLYAGLLHLADTQPNAVAALGIDQAADLAQRVTVFAGSTASRVSGGERLVVRNGQRSSPGGYYYESFELDPIVAGRSLLTDPLGFSQGQQGSVALFSLPNGLQAYVIFDEAGSRLGETLLVGAAQDDVMRSAISCMGCHRSGLLSFQDEVRDYVLGNPSVRVPPGSGLGPQDVLALYPPNEQLSQVLTTDGRLYQAAVGLAGVPVNATEPVSTEFQRFEQDVDLRSFAGDLHYPAADLEQNIVNLDPALSGLVAGSKLERDVVSALYVNSLCRLNAASDNRPADQECIAAGAR